MAKRRAKNKTSLITYISYCVLALSSFAKLYFLRSFGEEWSLGYYCVILFFVGVIGITVGTSHLESVSSSVRYRINRGQYKNALTMLKTSVFSSLFYGILIGAVLMILSNLLLDKVFMIKDEVFVSFIFMCISLVLFILLCGVLGYYEGYDVNVPLDSSRMIFGISNVLFGLLFVFVTKGSGDVNALLFHDEHIKSAHCALGASVGITLALFVTLIWNLALLISFNSRMKLKLLDDLSRGYESIFEQLRALTAASGFPAIRQFMIYCPYLVVMIYYFKRFEVPADLSGMGIPAFVMFGARYATGFISILLPVGITTLIGKRSASLIETVMRRDDAYHGGMQAVLAIKQFIATALPLCLICDVIINRLYTEGEFPFGGGSFLVLPLHALILFYILETYLLAGFSGEWKAAISGLIAFVLQFLFCMILMSKTCYESNIIVLCNILYVLCAIIINFVFLSRYLVYRKNLNGNILMPLVSVFAAVLACLLVMLLNGVLGPVISAVLSLLISFVVHTLSLVVTGSIRENETEDYPQKGLLKLIGRFLGFYR